MQELRADAVVEADAARDVLDIGADRSQRSAISLMKVILVARKALAAYLISSPCAGGEQDRRLVEIERAIDLLHHLAGALVLGADDDAVGALEILDRGALAQEFGVGDDGELGVGAGPRG
jgi:hypothetical protein